MNTQSIILCYDKFRVDYNLPDLKSCDLRLTPTKFSDRGELNRSLADFRPAGGWAQCQSELKLFQPGDDVSSWGPILQAQFCNDDGESLHVQWSSSSKSWLITRYTETVGDKYMFDAIALFAEEVPGNKMRYRRYWRDDEGMRYFASRFIGFGDAPK